MKAVHPYLNFDGNTEDAFNFYKSVFGGEFTALQRFKDTPFGEQLPVEERDKIMHVALEVTPDTMLMATDTLKSMGQELKPGNNYSITLSTESEEESNKLFNKLAEGGTVTMPLEKAFWGAYFGMLTDKFGIQWMINYDYK